MKRQLLILLVTTGLTACSMVPEFALPPAATPNQWQGMEANKTAAALRDESWWQQFNSPELDALVPAALEHNNDMRASLARIEQLRAALAIAGAPLYPQADIGGGASRSDRSGGSASESYSLGAGLSYEVDLFGRNRAGREAARESLSAGQFDREALGLIIASDVSAGYFQVLTLEERLAIARRNLSRAEDVFRIIEAQYNEGRISGLEMAQQRVELANNRAQLAQFENQLVAARNALAVLLGKAPQDFTVDATRLTGITAPAPVLSVPAEVIEQRPDIRRLEAVLRAANADIGAARAALYPALNLSADATLLANPSATATTLAASLFAPLFQGGRLRAGVTLSEARQQELAENYRQAVLVALQEVEDALASVKSAGERQVYFLEAATEADRAYNIATERFEAGAIDFQTLLDTQRAQLNASDSFHQSKLELLAAHVQLFRAQGGGWQ